MLRSLFVITFLLFGLPAFGETAHYLVKTRGPARATDLPLAATKFDLVDGFAAELTPDQVVRLRRNPRVEWIELDAERYVMGLRAAGSPRQGQLVPYGISAVHAPAIWSVSTGARVRVAILDTGIDVWHPDLAPNYMGGYDFAGDDPSPEDDLPFPAFSHGTHVAGTIGAVNNGIGVVGAAPNVELYMLKVFNRTGSARSSTIIRAIEWAIEHKMNILNCSFGGVAAVQLEEQAYRRATEANILIVAASGNGGSPGVHYPAAYDSVIAVGAVDQENEIAPFSNWGPQIELTAPGVEILSTTHVGNSSLAAVTLADGSSISAWAIEGAPTGEASGPIADAGIGALGDFSNFVPGSVALIERGQISFAEKLSNAKVAGAVAVVMYNHKAGECTLRVDADPAFPVSLCLTQSDGRALRERIGSRVMVGVYPDDYNFFTGTSNAVPHVTGVAALLWSLVPGATAAEIREALRATARDLGPPGRDDRYGHGLADAYAAARHLAPGLFPPSPRSRAVRH